MEVLANSRLCVLTDRLSRVTGRPLQPTELLHEVHQEITSREERLRSLTDEVHSLCRLRNSASPINRLPLHVLVEIFSYLHNHTPYLEDQIAFNAATAVCKHWRTAALGAPKFWTNFYLRDSELTGEYLERSGALPLSVYLDRDHKGSVEKTGKALAPHVGRLQSLCVELTSIKDLRAFIRSLTDSAPRLQELTIEYEALDCPTSRMVSFPIPFGGSLPSLRMLSLHDVAFPSIPSLPNLRVLDIHGWVPSAAHVLDYLEKCPLLESATLFALAFADNSDVGARVVSLPHLSRLRLESLDPPECRALLSHLALPETVKICLHMDTNGQGPMFPRDPASLANLRCFTVLERLELRCLDPTSYALRAAATTQPIAHPDAALVAEAWEHDLPLHDWMPALPNLKTFVLYGSRHSPLYIDWAAFLRGHPQLEELHILSASSDMVLDALYALLPPAEIAEDDAVEPARERERMCPRLRVLEIRDVQWLAPLVELVCDFAEQKRRGCVVNVGIGKDAEWTEEAQVGFAGRDNVRVSVGS